MRTESLLLRLVLATVTSLAVAACGPAELIADTERSVDNLDSALVTLPKPVISGVEVVAASHVLRIRWQTNSQSAVLTSIERSGSAAGPFTRVGRVAADLSGFDDPTSDLSWIHGETFFYRIRTRDAAGGVSPLSKVVSASTDTEAPTVPAIGGIRDTTETTITFNWGASTDNQTVVEYRVFRDGHLVASVAAPATSFTDSGLWPHSTHSYYVSAVDAAGNVSGVSYIVTGYTKNDITPPSAPTNLIAQFNRAAGSVSLSRGASTDNFGVTAYRIFRNDVLVATQSAASGTTAYVGSLASGTSYQFAVIALDAQGNESGSAKVSVTTR